MPIDPQQIIKDLLKSENQKAADADITLDEIDALGSDDDIKKMFHNINDYRTQLKESITFVNDALTSVIPFTRQNLYLIAAYTGNGKSSLSANIAYPLWQENKKVLIISNEEPNQDVMFRIACLHLGLNFNDYKKGKMPREDVLRVMQLFPIMKDYVKVLAADYKNGLTRTVEGVKKALEAVQKSDYSCVMIDYYQLVKTSIQYPNKSTYEILNDLRTWLTSYIATSNVPVVLFAQLHSLGKRGKDIDARIKECPTIIETATVIIEMIPDFENSVSDFCVIKDRFGFTGKRIRCPFDKGRYIAATQQDLDTWIQNRRLKRAQENAANLFAVSNQENEDEST